MNATKCTTNSTSATFQTARRTERIPRSLQAIFVSSNKGAEVHCPPPERVASKVFSTGWFRNKCTRQSSFRNPSVNRQESQIVTTPKLQKVAPTKNYAPTPQAYLNSILLARGYSTEEYPSLNTAYYNKKPTALQHASYGIRLLDAARKGDAYVVRTLLDTGLSPNACNQRGESLVHAVCRRGQADMLRILMEYGCKIQIADDYGRTPLHDACWAAQPCFEVVELLLQVDSRLFYIADVRGSLPLAYVSQDQWTQWTKFLMSKKNVYWPERDMSTVGVEAPPPLTLERPNSRPVPDPKRVLPVCMVTLVAAGRMEPEEVEYLLDDGPSETEVDDDDSEDSDSYVDIDSDSDNREDEDDFIAFGEQEMARVAKSLLCSKPIEWTLPEAATASVKSSSSTTTTVQSEGENDDESHVLSSKTDSNDCDCDDEDDLGSSHSTLFDEDEFALVLSSIGGVTPLTWSPTKRISA